MECIQQTLNGAGGPGSRVVATVQRSGDLVHDSFIKIKSDESTITNYRGYNPGYNVINSIEVEIGGQTIDKQFGHFLEAYSELTNKSGGTASTSDAAQDIKLNVNNISPNSMAPKFPLGQILQCNHHHFK